jgi:hypothetical protein
MLQDPNIRNQTEQRTIDLCLIVWRYFGFTHQNLLYKLYDDYPKGVMAGLSSICKGNGGNKSLDFKSWQVNIIKTIGRILSKKHSASTL